MTDRDDGLRQSKKGGCLRALKIAAAVCVLLPLGMCAGVCAWSKWDDPRGRLPPHIEVNRVLTANSQAGLLEGCVYAAYELAPKSVMLLKQRGLGALIGTRPSKDFARNPYGEWRATPLLFDTDRKALGPNGERFAVYALYADTGCGRHLQDAPDVHQLLKTPGNFYALTANREGMVVISPAAGIAVFMYFG